jgi:DNA-directed RNA polymerase specialized sigma24 family protein
VKGREVREPAAYGSWLFTIAKNLIAGHYRRVTGSSIASSAQARSCASLNRRPGPRIASFVTSVGKLIEFVRELPPRDRELISLKFDAELSNAEIMGLTPLNIRVAIFRPLRRLPKRMQSAQPEESFL